VGGKEEAGSMVDNNDILTIAMMGIFGPTAVAALITQLFSIRKTNAEAAKIRAETNNIQAQDLKKASTVQDPEMPEGWFAFGEATVDYEMGIDRTVVHRGTACGYIKSIRPPRGFGSLTQMFKSDSYRGKRLQMSAYAKTEDVRGWAGLWMRIDSTDGETLIIDNMADRRIQGTTGWTKYLVVLDVPESGAYVAFGILLEGEGQVWVDDLELLTVGHHVPTTTNVERGYLDHPVNLNFEN
jgi:hypothetical protein